MGHLAKTMRVSKSVSCRFAGVLSSVVVTLLATSSAVAAPVATKPQVGAAIFEENCAACHQPQGQGIPGAFPALANNVFVKGDPKVVANVLLNGRAGMPAFKSDLSDAEIAAVLTFVRSSWGNRAVPVTPAIVMATRNTRPPEAARALMQAH
jgi:mono/diheme cytochrome c family protein